MNIVVLGLSLSSSWGNGHATTYRALLRELGKSYKILFLEREQEWYAQNRDLPAPDFCELRFYDGIDDLRCYRARIEAADAVILGSYVPEGAAITEMIKPWIGGVFCFYDIDTPVTLAKLESGGIDYISRATLPLFDIYFSFTGGPALRKLERRFGANLALPLYCSADPARYRPLDIPKRWVLGYLGTYSADRQPTLEKLLLEPARRAPQKKFVVAGPMYPKDIAWPENVERIEHLPPDAHAAFYNAQDWTLNITRADMVAAGYSPSVRLFEAAACGTPVISDFWAGIETVFEPGQELLIANHAEDVLAALEMPQARRRQMGQAARARFAASHSAARRAAELEDAIAALAGLPAPRLAVMHR